MESFYYTREFFYRERRSFDEFFAENALWKTLYDFFDGKKYLGDRGGYFYPQLVDFNEAYLYFNVIMVGLLSDKELEECYDRQTHSIDVNPFNSYKDDVNDEFCLVLLYVLLALSDDLTDSQRRFLRKFDHVDFAHYDDWYEDIKDFVADQKAKGLKYDLWYGVVPEHPDVFLETYCKQSANRNYPMIESLCFDCGWWWLNTDRFDKDVMRKVIGLWKDPEERLQMVKILSDRYNKYYGPSCDVNRFDADCAILFAELRENALSESHNEKALELANNGLTEDLRSCCINAKGILKLKELEQDILATRANRLEGQIDRLNDKLNEKNNEIVSLRKELLDVRSRCKCVSDILRYAEELEKSDAKVVKSMIDSVYRGVKFSEEEARRIDALAKRERRSGVPGVVIENMHGSVNGSVTQNIDKGNDNKLIDR